MKTKLKPYLLTMALIEELPREQISKSMIYIIIHADLHHIIGGKLVLS
jgi:hypothetical protein